MCSRSLLFLCLHLFVSPPCSCYFRIHLTRVTVNMSWITKTCPVLLSPSVYNGRDNLTTEKLFGKMGQYNSIVTALYWKQPSWEGSPSLSLSHFQPLTVSFQSCSFTRSFKLFLSIPIIPSFIID